MIDLQSGKTKVDRMEEGNQCGMTLATPVKIEEGFVLEFVDYREITHEVEYRV
ncbi:MAG: hypothetical protein U9Q15_01175 [Patescibacteria group bacterium]|nr:hypothetical protein [Patescibacteria group bacterium]